MSKVVGNQPAGPILSGNRTLHQVADIASKHRMKIFIPATCFIGASEYMNSKDRLIFEVKYKDEFESEYGYIAMVKNQKKDAFSCVYVFHRLKMKLAKRRVETRTLRRLFGIFPIGEDVSVHYENVKLGTNDIDAIKETYMRHKALQALRDQGIIQEITYDP